MNNAAIAKVFQDIADLLELKGENVFKVRAYQRAARAIEHLPAELEQLAREEVDLSLNPSPKGEGSSPFPLPKGSAEGNPLRRGSRGVPPICHAESL